MRDRIDVREQGSRYNCASRCRQQSQGENKVQVQRHYIKKQVKSKRKSLSKKVVVNHDANQTITSETRLSCAVSVQAPAFYHPDDDQKTSPQIFYLPFKEQLNLRQIVTSFVCTKRFPLIAYSCFCWIIFQCY